ncbi:MAG: hypothetical protein FWF28_00265 [Micrococcales bacterium]|nr:hypothetical protein [Micrococcales bacterium]
MDTIYDRNVVIVHLRNLRFLEMARERLRGNLADADWKIANNGQARQPSFPRHESVDEDLTATIVGWSITTAVLGLILWGVRHVHVLVQIAWVLTGIAAIIAGIAIAMGIYRASENSRAFRLDRARYDKQVSDDWARVQRELAERAMLIDARPRMLLEWQAADALLKKAYGANIIPSQFRTLYAVYFLYEFLSTSREPLHEALLHYDLDEIKRKLDVVIEQQEQIIINQEIQISQNDQMKRQSDEILKHAIATERNTETAAQYTRVAAANSEALVWAAGA